MSVKMFFDGTEFCEWAAFGLLFLLKKYDPNPRFLEWHRDVIFDH